MVKIGNLEMRELGVMDDSSQLYVDQDWDSIRRILDENGYVMLKGVLDGKIVDKVRSLVLDTLQSNWNMVDVVHHDLDEGFVNNFGNKKGMLLTGYRAVTHHRDMLELIEGEKMSKIMKNIFNGETPSTYSTKWLRVIGKNESTDEHTDFYRFSSHATNNRMYTCWIPLGQYTVDNSTLCICKYTHNIPEYSQYTHDCNFEYKNELPGEFKPSDYQDEWVSSNFSPGDLVIFDIRTIHASSVNLTNQFRISIDTRWIASSDISQESNSMFTNLNF